MKHMKYSMDMQTANDILQNVFLAGEQAPNTIPFDKLVLRGKARTTLISVALWISTVMLVLILLSPLAFRSSFKVEDHGVGNSVRITSHQLYTDVFVLLIAGDHVDYDAIYALKNDGTPVYPTHIRFVNDEIEVTLPYDGSALNIYIPDDNGNTLQAVLSER